MNIKSLAVKDYGPFVGQHVFKFKPGVSVVYGLNQCSGKHSRNSNWVGKSLFFNSLSELLYDEPIVGMKQDKMKTGTRGCSFELNGKSVQVIKRSGKRESVEIKVDGNAIEHLTKTKANEWIEKHWSVSRAEFETFIHLDSRVPHPLVMGSSTDRKKFFDDFFRLERIDYERRLYLKALRDLASVKAAFTELKQSYNLQKSQVLDDADYEELLEELSSLTSKREVLEKKASEVDTYRKLQIIWDSLKGSVSKFSSLSTVEEEVERARSEYEKLVKLRKCVREYKEYRIRAKQYKEAKESLSELASSCSLEKLKKGSELYTKAKGLYSVHNITLKSLKVPEAPENPYGKRCELAPLQVKRAQVEHAIEHAKKFKSGICPTCGQEVEKVDLPTLEEELRKIKFDICVAQQWIEFDAYEKASREYWDKYKEIFDKVKEAKERILKYEKYAKAYDEVKELPKKPKKVEKPKFSEEELENRVQSLHDIIKCGEVVVPYLKDLIRYKEWSGAKDMDYDEYNKLGEKIARIEARLTVNKEARTTLNATTKRLKELKKQLKDEPIIRILVDVFSDKTIKRTMVTQISSVLCSLLNRYAKIVFEQDYTFNLVWDTQLQLLCTRRVGKMELTSDVRKLSGAESKLFTLILILALLSFVPAERRPCVMILDEPTANFSTETTQAFMRLLDILKTVVPSIVIITPRDDIYPDSAPYTIVRTKSGSVIKEGLPDEFC